ncbi:hypothetical protein KCP77_19860 [Salmonella enterica subsp. enterica]|nr:hypothetical protein KCP77_19860 [Salmonella enterica subsp. enterica]
MAAVSSPRPPGPALHILNYRRFRQHGADAFCSGATRSTILNIGPAPASAKSSFPIHAKLVRQRQAAVNHHQLPPLIARAGSPCQWRVNQLDQNARQYAPRAYFLADIFGIRRKQRTGGPQTKQHDHADAGRGLLCGRSGWRRRPAPVEIVMQPIAVTERSSSAIIPRHRQQR